MAKPPDDELFLPDFCDMGTVLTVVVVGALLAFILVLSPVVSTSHWWRDLALNSLFIQWVGSEQRRAPVHWPALAFHPRKHRRRHRGLHADPAGQPVVQ